MFFNLPRWKPIGGRGDTAHKSHSTIEIYSAATGLTLFQRSPAPACRQENYPKADPRRILGNLCPALTFDDDCERLSSKVSAGSISRCREIKDNPHACRVYRGVAASLFRVTPHL